MKSPRLCLGLAVIAALALAPSAHSQREEVLAGSTIHRGMSLGESGWRNFLGQSGERPALSNGVELLGSPRLPAVFLTINPRSTETWWAGLMYPFSALPETVKQEELFIRAKVAGSKPGPVTLRLESSPGHWIGFQVVLPANGQWLEFEESLAHSQRMGRFDLTGNSPRLVIAFAEPVTSIWSGEGVNTLSLHQLELIWRRR
jgi:hypothetical protein